MKQQRKRGAIFVEDQTVVKDQILLNKKKKIVAEVKPQEAVPNKKEHVADSELRNSPMFDESDEEDEDDFLDDIMPMMNKCNLDIVYKELQKEPKFKNVSKWLKGIQGNVILPTLEPVVQAIVPGFVSTEAVGKLGAGSKLSEFVPPESMGNFGAGMRLPGFVPPESMRNLGEGTKLPGFVRPESMGNVGVGSKLPGFGSTFRLSSSSPGIVKECSPIYTQIKKMLRTHTSETLTPRASLPLDVETMHQEEQNQEEVHVDEVLVLDIGSKREELIEQCPQQREVSRSSYGLLEMSEFEKYLTGNNDTEQKNNNNGAAILTATFTGHENDGIAVQKSPVQDDISNVAGRNSGDKERIENCNSVQKSGAEDDIANAEVDIANATGRNLRDAEGVENSNSVQKSGAEDDIVNAAGRNSRDTEGVENSNSVQKSRAEHDIVNVEVDIANAAGRNSRDAEGVENSNSVQKSGVEDDIANAEVDIGNTTGRNSRDAERVENSNSESRNSDGEHANPTTKEENPTTKEENPEVEDSETDDSKAISSEEEEGMVIAKVENPEDEQKETSESESNNTDREDAKDISEPENLDDEELEEDSESDSNSSEEEDLVGNNSGNPEDVSKPEQPKNCEQLNIAEFEKSGEQEDIVAEKINEPGGRFVNYFSASHRIPKALDVMHAKGNVIPLSEICRMYLGINRDTVAVYMSSCKMKCCYKVFRSRKFQNLVVHSTNSLNVDTLDKKLQDITTSVLSGKTHNSTGKSSDTEGENYLPLPSYFLSRAKEQANIKCQIIILDQILLIFFSFKPKKPESLKAMVPSTKERTVVPVLKRKVNIMPETKVSGKESGNTRRQRNETGSDTRIKKSGRLQD